MSTTNSSSFKELGNEFFLSIFGKYAEINLKDKHVCILNVPFLKTYISIFDECLVQVLEKEPRGNVQKKTKKKEVSNKKSFRKKS